MEKLGYIKYVIKQVILCLWVKLFLQKTSKFWFCKLEQTILVPSNNKLSNKWLYEWIIYDQNKLKNASHRNHISNCTPQGKYLWVYKPITKKDNLLNDICFPLQSNITCIFHISYFGKLLKILKKNSKQNQFMQSESYDKTYYQMMKNFKVILTNKVHSNR